MKKNVSVLSYIVMFIFSFSSAFRMATPLGYVLWGDFSKGSNGMKMYYVID